MIDSRLQLRKGVLLLLFNLHHQTTNKVTQEAPHRKTAFLTRRQKTEGPVAVTSAQSIVALGRWGILSDAGTAARKATSVGLAFSLPSGMVFWVSILFDGMGILVRICSWNTSIGKQFHDRKTVS